MKSSELREAFLSFFAEREHTRVQSAPLVPKADPTLLFNVAGMVQFKPMWTGLVEPLPYKRATSVQKCLRLNDLDLVGTDATHDTFFEMLGNFSFGDYQKKEAIGWAWEFVTRIMKLPSERLWITVHETDEEAKKLWQEVAGVPADRIIALGDADNFWGPVGGRGACGPSSEIFWDLDWKKGDCGPGPGSDEADARYTEIWNLVFPQFDQQEDGSRPPLKYRGIDTGGGLERMVLAVQDTETVFHTDLFKPLMQAAADTVDVKITADSWEPLAITADHVRAITFVIAEGVRPSNSKQGYVVRTLLRRALGALYPLGVEEPLLYRISGQVVEQMAEAYPELPERREQVALMIKGEEERFLATLEKGMRLFEDAAGAGKISGSDAFKLHDTFGFPIDLTKLLAAHKGIEVDLEGYEEAMQIQRSKSRSATSGTFLSFGDSDVEGEIGQEKFVGYERDNLRYKTHIMAVKLRDDGIGIVLAEQPFYAEAGGQVGDTGKLTTEDGKEYDVVNTVIDASGNRVCIVRIEYTDFKKLLREELTSGKVVCAVVNAERRMEIERAHTATHMLHAALRAVLGKHVKQEGSLVEPGRLRFDFYHPSPMTEEELLEVEKIVYDWVIQNHSTTVKEMSKEEAEAKGALAFFGEKYGEKVRVAEIEGVTAELCGGTHLEQTGDIGTFLITSESGVAAGIRRIEALVGQRAWRQISHVRSILTEVSDLVGTDPDKLIKRVEDLKQKLASNSRARERIAQHFVHVLSEQILSKVITIGNVDFAVARTEALGRDELRILADALKSRRNRIVGLLAAPDKNSRLAVLCFSVSADYNAGEILKASAKKLKGGGGGSASLAEGSVAETSLVRLSSVFMEVVKSVKPGAKGKSSETAKTAKTGKPAKARKKEDSGKTEGSGKEVKKGKAEEGKKTAAGKGVNEKRSHKGTGKSKREES